MTRIMGTVIGGRLEVDVPIDWPDGTQVEIHPLEAQTGGGTEAAATAEIARTLAAMDQMLPFEMSDAEQAAWEAEQRANKDREKAESAKRAERLLGMWD